GGATVTGPCHVPASDFSSVKDFCASDCGLVADVCISCWATATVARHSRAKGRIKRRVFMFVLLRNSRPDVITGCDTLLVNYNTTMLSSIFKLNVQFQLL